MYGMAKEMSNIIRPWVGHFPHHIWNTQDFVDQVKAIRLRKGECNTSYDMKAIFTLVRVDPAFSIIKHRLEQNIQLCIRTSISIQCNTTPSEFCLKTPITSSKVSIMNRYMGIHRVSHQSHCSQTVHGKYEIKAINPTPHPQCCHPQGRTQQPIYATHQLHWCTHPVHKGDWWPSRFYSFSGHFGSYYDLTTHCSHNL